MVSLTGWNFALRLRWQDSALTGFVYAVLGLLIAGGADRLATAFSSRDFDKLIAAIRQQPVELGAIPAASPARA